MLVIHSGTYCKSRMLLGMAEQGDAPKGLAKIGLVHPWRDAVDSGDSDFGVRDSGVARVHVGLLRHQEQAQCATLVE